jgi:hypothetical protein
MAGLGAGESAAARAALAEVLAMEPAHLGATLLSTGMNE